MSFGGVALFVIQSLSLVLPILVAGLMLILVLKNNYFPKLNVPIDSYVKLGGKRLFGDNKTWRGVLVYVVVSIVICFLLSVVAHVYPWFVHPVFSLQPLLIGLAFSVSYILGELINSSVKRRYGIAAGEQSGSLTQRIIDNIDGMIILALVLMIVFNVAAASIFAAIIAGIILHQLTDVIMKRQGLKA